MRHYQLYERFTNSRRHSIMELHNWLALFALNKTTTTRNLMCSVLVPLWCRRLPGDYPRFPQFVRHVQRAVFCVSKEKNVSSVPNVKFWQTIYTCWWKIKYLFITELCLFQLAAKANRQLQDPLVIMTGNLPPWLKKIAYAWYVLLRH